MAQLGPALAVVREGAPAAQRLVQGDPQCPHVGRRAELREALALALLGRHVAVGARRGAHPGQLPGAPRDAQVDQPRVAGHDHVAGLDVEVHDALAAQIVQYRAEVEGQGQELLEDHAVATDQGGEPGPLDELEHQVRARSVEHRSEGAQQHRVGQALEMRRLTGEPVHGVAVAHAVGAHHLGHHQRPQVVVPGQ